MMDGKNRGGDRWTMMHGDSLVVLRTLKDESCDILITDPPYSSGGMVRGDRMSSTRTKYVRSDAAAPAADFTGDNRDQRSYLAWCSLWLAECRRVLRPGAWAIVFTDWRQLPTTTDAVQAGGFIWRGIMPWYKPAHRHVRGGVSLACEYAVVATNGPAVVDAPQIVGFYSESAPRERLHQTQKPAGLIAHALGLAPADSHVLDPFAGSGTTGVVAVSMGHRFTGIELSWHFYTVACDRLEGTVRDPAGCDQGVLL